MASRRSLEKKYSPLSSNPQPPAYHECVRTPPPQLDYENEQCIGCAIDEKPSIQIDRKPPGTDCTAAQAANPTLITTVANMSVVEQNASARSTSEVTTADGTAVERPAASATKLAVSAPSLMYPPLSPICVRPPAGIRFRSQLTQATGRRFLTGISSSKPHRPRAKVDYAALACVQSQCDVWGRYFVLLQCVAVCVVLLTFLAAIIVT